MTIKQTHPRLWAVLVALLGLGVLVGSWMVVAVQLLATVFGGAVKILTFPLRRHW